jgi:hypothetical protein
MTSLIAAPTNNLAQAPLAPRSGPRGATMFTIVPPEQSGVVTENPYDDPKMWGERYQEYALGSMGTGVAIGDYDNDGRPDLFVANKTGQCRLFRNRGNWKFEDVTAKAGLLIGEGVTGLQQWNQGVVFADVNNDGWLDIYVCRFNAPNLLYINQHDGTFKEEARPRGLAVVDASVCSSFCDYDRDGFLDVYIAVNMLDATKHPDGQVGYLFHNNGDGTFTNVTARAGTTARTLSHAALWWDYDGDGWPDLYVTDDFFGPDVLYHNNRDGTFTNVLNRTVPHTPDSAMGADLGDVNNDGRLDFIVADMAMSTHERDQRGMALSRGLTPADDGGGEVPQYQRNALYLNTGTGHMLEAACLAGFPATDWTWSTRFEDLDNDGRLDLFVTNGMSREYQNADLRQKVLVTESLDERMRIMKASPLERDQHFAYRNLGDIRFEDVSAPWGLNQVGVSFGAAFGDLDGDGDLDLVYSNYQSGVTVLRNDSDSGHRLIVALRGTKSNHFGIGALVRIETASGVQVRPLVLMRGYESSSEPVAHFGLGGDTRVNRLTIEWPSGVEQVFQDLAGDQRLTITEPAETTHVASAPSGPFAGAGTSAETRPAGSTVTSLFEDVTAALNLRQGARESFAEEPRAQPLVPVRFNHRGPALAVGDLTGDGRPDFVLGGTAKDPLRVLVADPAGPFVAADISALAGSPSAPDGPVLIFDANGDGHNDLLLTKAGAGEPEGGAVYQPRLVLGDANGGLTPAPPDALPELHFSVGAVAAVDFDHDGWLDVFLGGRVLPGKYPLAPRSALLRNQGGRFEDVTDAIAPGLRNVGMVSSAIWSDVDGDGWPDLLLALEWGPVRYFHNDGGRAFSDWTEKAGFASGGAGWWTSLAVADFNGDGRPDYVAGNVGLNTQYRATHEHPTLIYYGDFGRAGGPIAIEAYYEGDKLFPRRTRNDLGALIPSVKQRFRRNDLYARATLQNIVGDEGLARAQRFAATELRSGVFLSQADGTYRFEALPRIAQIAPAQGMVAADFDGDGNTDLAIVQNSYAPTAWVGHFDGGIGQILRGDGKGHFTPIEPLDSNFIVTGDAKALVLADLDDNGWPDLVATQNNATLLAFRDRGSPHRHALRVRLQGPKSNPTAIGARVMAELADGSRQLAEVSAGSGYYSESSPDCFFGYPDANPPRRVSVRWPDGRTSTHAVPSGESKLTLPAP